MTSPELVALEEKQLNKNQNNKTVTRYSTRETIKTEGKMIVTAEKLRSSRKYHVKLEHVQQAVNQQNRIINSKTPGGKLSDDQLRAIQHVTYRGQLKVVLGHAGSGKSTMLAVARKAWELDGRQVIGAALSGKAADGLQQSSGIKSRTIASLIRSWRSGHSQLQKGDVLVVDEAGMVDNEQLSEIIKEVDANEAKLVLVGDPEQLQSIGAGAGLRAITNQVGSVNLTEIRRQNENWQRKATSDFANQRTEHALASYIRHKRAYHIDDTEDLKNTHKQLAGEYLIDAKNDPNKTRLALAHQKKDVKMINAAIRCVRKNSYEIDDGVLIETSNGIKEFAIGDRITFLKNNKKLGVQNGSLGTIKNINKNNLVVNLDDNGNSVRIPLHQYNHIDHGYATTIHKAQGATVDQTYVLTSKSMDRHTTYVAMTRHRENASLFVSETEFENADELKHSLSRSGLDETTHDFNHSFSLNRGIDTISSPQQEAKNQPENITFQVEPERRSKRDDKELEMIEEIAPKKHLKPSNTSSAPKVAKHELEKALDNYSCIYEQVLWSNSFGFEITQHQTEMLQLAEKKLKQIDPIVFKQLQSVEHQAMESTITELSGQERVDMLIEHVQEGFIPSNDIKIKPTLKPTPKNDDENEDTYIPPSPQPTF